MFRVTRGQSGFDGDTIERAREIVRTHEPGRYYVDELEVDPFPSGHTSRARQRLIQHADERVEDEPHSWAD
jgi:hypothetical protein